MWILKILNGPQTGQTFNLKRGQNTVGRSSECDIRIENTGISKVHALITVTEDKVFIADNQSRNGTYINGVKITQKRLHLGDRINLHEIVFEVIGQEQLQALPGMLPSHHQASRGRSPYQQQQLAQQNAQRPAPASVAPSPFPTPEVQPASASKVAEQLRVAQDYFENNVVQPYLKIAEKQDPRWVVAGSILAVVVFCCLLSIIPYVQFTQENMLQEAERSAVLMARQMAEYNRIAVGNRQFSLANTQFIQLQEGVRQALIVDDKSGEILAPVSLAGQQTGLAFVHRGRKENKEVFDVLEDDVVGASAPITYFNTTVGGNDTMAHAVVVYHASHLSVSMEEILALLVQSLLLGLLVGGIICLLINKLIDNLWDQLNASLDRLLRDNSTHLDVPFTYPPVQKMGVLINSLLNRKKDSGKQDQELFGVRKDLEAENLTSLVGFPALAIDSQLKIVAFNKPFEAMVNLNIEVYRSQSMERIPDQALRLSLLDLMERAQSNSGTPPSNPLDFHGVNYTLAVQPVFEGGKVAYYLFVIFPSENVEVA